MVQKCFWSAQSRPMWAAKAGGCATAGVGCGVSSVDMIVGSPPFGVIKRRAGRTLFPRRPYSKVVLTRRLLSIRFGNQAHPAVEALTVDIGCYVNSICQGAVFVSAGCLLALLPCHRPSPMTTERNTFPQRPVATTVENLPLKVSLRSNYKGAGWILDVG